MPARKKILQSAFEVEYTFSNSSPSPRIQKHLFGAFCKRMYKVITSLIGIFILTGLAVSQTSRATTTTAFSNDDDDENEVFQLVNRERTRSRLPVLEWNPDAARLARSYSKRMARDGFFDHYDPEGNSVIERAESARLKHWSRIGENLFVCDAFDGFAEFAIRGWLKSPTHRQNMLDRSWTSTGIGIARSRNGDIYITEVFLEK